MADGLSGGEGGAAGAGGSRAARMEAAFRAAFSPTVLTIEDDSARHAGHAGASAGGETHYSVKIVSESFAGRNRVERSRMAYAVLNDEFVNRLHAISFILRTPTEDKT